MEHGLCHCGCGQRTRLVRGTSRWRRFIKGHPNRGALHYQWKGGSHELDGYRHVRIPEHPRANNGYVREHILVAELVLAKSLPDAAVVHHVNGDKLENRPGNLVICQDQNYHLLLEARSRAYDACGNAGWVRCQICKQYDAPENLNHRKDRRVAGVHSACNIDYQRNLRRKRAALRKRAIQ